MQSRRTLLRVGPLLIESRVTTRDLVGFDIAAAEQSPGGRSDDDGGERVSACVEGTRIDARLMRRNS